MSTHNICFCGEIRKIIIFFWLKNKTSYLSRFTFLKLRHLHYKHQTVGSQPHRSGSLVFVCMD